MIADDKMQLHPFDLASNAIEKIIDSPGDEVITSKQTIITLLLYLLQSSVFQSKIIVAAGKANAGELTKEEFSQLLDQSAKMDRSILEFASSLTLRNSVDG